MLLFISGSPLKKLLGFFVGWDSVADPDTGSGAFLPGWIRDQK
jgi:hypothetical protein